MGSRETSTEATAVPRAERTHPQPRHLPPCRPFLSTYFVIVSARHTCINRFNLCSDELVLFSCTLHR